jgi:predicted nucleotidyltransferase
LGVLFYWEKGLFGYGYPSGIFKTGWLGILYLKYYLEELLKLPVDLVTPEALKPQIKDRILKEVRYQ